METVSPVAQMCLQDFSPLDYSATISNSRKSMRKFRARLVTDRSQGHGYAMKYISKLFQWSSYSSRQSQSQPFGPELVTMLNVVLFRTLSFSTLVVASPLSLSSIDTRSWDNGTSSSSPSDLFARSPQLDPTDTNSYFPIPPDLNVPDGYYMGFSTVNPQSLPHHIIATLIDTLRS